MDSLNRLTGDTVTLSTLSGVNVQYLHVVPSTQPLRFEVPVGYLRSVFVSGAGWALLGALTDAQLEELVRQINFQERDRSKKVTLTALLERVNTARENGYAFSKHMIVRGGGSIAVLLPEASFKRRFAVAVHGLVEHLEQREAVIVKGLRAGLKPLG